MAYEPGSLYRRELPPLLAALEVAAAEEPVDLVLVDGHAWLGPDRPGLGHHLWTALGGTIPVIGVAKAAFAGGVGIEVLRGASRRPLFVSAVGADVAAAVSFVRRMHGPNRIPSMIAHADGLCRARLAAELRG